MGRMKIVNYNAMCDYLTTGKPYTVIEHVPQDNGNVVYKILDDNGDVCHVVKHDCPHAQSDWEEYNMSWRVIKKEEIKNYPVGTKVRIDGQEDEIVRHYPSNDDPAFDIKDWDGGVFCNNDWNHHTVEVQENQLTDSYSTPEEEEECEKMENKQDVTAADILRAGLKHMEDRATTYDKPEGERSMAATVAAFNAVTDGKVDTEEKGWLFMVLLKIVRSQQGDFKLDNYEDGGAYFGLMGEAANKERE